MKLIEYVVAGAFVAGALALAAEWIPESWRHPEASGSSTAAPVATAPVPAAPPVATEPPAEPGKHWRIAFDIPGGDQSGAAYALENRAGDRYAIAMRCTTNAAPNRPAATTKETCAADVPNALRGQSAQLVQLWLGEVYWRSPERLQIPIGDPR